MRISDWSSDVCSSDLVAARSTDGGAMTRRRRPSTTPYGRGPPPHGFAAGRIFLRQLTTQNRRLRLLTPRAPSCFSLVTRRRLPHLAPMAQRSLYQRLRSHAQMRPTLFALGILLTSAGVAHGPLPAPRLLHPFPAGL